MFKKVVSAGCSYSKSGFEVLIRDPKFITYEALDENGKQISFTSYSEQLAIKLDAKQVQLAKAGTGIPFAIRQLWYYIETHKEELEDSLFILGLSEISRMDMYLPIDKPIEGKMLTNGISDNFDSFKIPHYFHYRDTGKEEESDYLQQLSNHYNIPVVDLRNFAELYWKYFYTDENAFAWHSMLLSTFNEYCKVNNVNLITLNTLNIDPRDTTSHVEGLKFSKAFDFSPYIELFKFPNSIYSWKKYIYSYDQSYDGTHPNTYDHFHLAEILYNHVNLLYSKNFAKKFPRV